MNWNFLPFNIFPEGSLASSVITTVWVGVAVVAFFNLRFGWSLAGLVVPGYLVPLLLIKPWSVAVIIGEGIVTYLVVLAVSSVGGRYLGLADFFGRDRFFALVLTSVIVRVIFDAYWLPELGDLMGTYFGLDFDYANNLHSFGLIIVALIANNFWKPGLVRGSFWLLVTLVSTFVIVRYGLMELTNFSVSNLNYLYEEMASSILASPKAYIILLTTAFIASRMNLHYAWEFNGILIPSLLALQWYQPTKLLLTFAEVGVILIAVHLLLKLPFFANINLSGARKLVFFFSVGFVYKLMLGYGFALFAPWVKVTDFFAFGYLISTLLALKIHDKDIGIRVTRATLQTSLTAVILASFIGFALSFIPARLKEDALYTERLSVPTQTLATLDDFLLRQRVADYSLVGRKNLPQPSGVQLASFQDALLALKRYQTAGESNYIDQAQLILFELDYTISKVEDRYLLLSEVGLPRGWGTYVIDTRPENRLVIEIPSAIGERGMTEAGLALFRDQNAAALAMNSISLRESNEGSSNVTRNPGTFFHQFHHTFGPNNVVQVRLINRAIERELIGEHGPETSDIYALQNQLLVKKQLPEDLKLQSLERLLGGISLRWDSLSIPNVQRERTDSGFAELYLNPDALRPLLARSHSPDASPLPLVNNEGSLIEYLLEKTSINRMAVETDYRQPRLDELLFLDLEILSPLLELVMTGPLQSWSEDKMDELHYLNGLAKGLGYRITGFQDLSRRQDYLILENIQDDEFYLPWGIYVIATDLKSPHLIQVPRPLFENNTLETGTAIFQTLEAAALMIAGSHPYLDPAGRADVLRASNQRSLFNLVHQVFVREAEGGPLLITQVRGLNEQVSTQAKSFLAFEDGLRPEAASLPLRERLRQTLYSMGLEPKEVLGAEETAGYEVGSNAQTRYLAAARNTDFAIAWIASSAREAFELPSDDRQQQLKFQALDIATLNTSLIQQVGQRGLANTALPSNLTSLLEHYVETGDIVALRQLQTSGYQLFRVLDSDSRQAFLQVSQKMENAPILAIVNLNPLNQEIIETASNSMDNQIEYFVDRRAFLLRSGNKQ